MLYVTKESIKHRFNRDTGRYEEYPEVEFLEFPDSYSTPQAINHARMLGIMGDLLVSTARPQEGVPAELPAMAEASL